MRRLLFVVALLGIGASAASAQTAEGGPDPSRVRVRIGPLSMNPTISLGNLGIDDNVFNDPPSAVPKRDFTMTVTPQTTFWLRMGRTWLNGVIGEDIVWFQKYASERSANTNYTVTWKVPLTRVAFSTTANWLKTRARPGFEIDSRSLRAQQAYTATAEIRALSKTFIGMRADFLKVAFDENAVFRGTNLRDALNRNTVATAVTIRHQLTPLTNLTFAADRLTDRFESLHIRDSDSSSVKAGVSFDPFALIKGSAVFGYRAFKPISPDVPRYNGSTIDVNLNYTLLGATRFGLQATRDVEYSYDVGQPYYLLTGAAFSIAQQVFGPLDVVGRIGRDRLEYRTRAGAQVATPDRTDRVSSYGGGFGYRLGQNARLGFDIDNRRRTSAIAPNGYQSLRFGASMTYGL
jgi:hypothetical protein